VVEGEDHFVLAADLPGLTADDVTIDVKDGVLSISGERTLEREVKEGGYARVERSRGSFKRSLTLPEGTDVEAIAASFENGVLEVKIPKPVASQPRRIEIAAGQPKVVEAGEPTAA
jgi:HSP20 family protein